MKNMLPIENGERPLFKGLDLLEEIYRDIKRTGNAYENIKSEYIINSVAKIYVFAEIIKKRDKRGIRNNSYDLFNELKELPLFFNIEQVKEWEIEKKWNNTNFIPYKNILMDYEIMFDTLTPSDVYQVNNEITTKIWQEWLIKSHISEIIKTLEYSASILLKWNKNRIEKTHLEKNLNQLCESLELTQEETKNWFYLEVLTEETNNLWNIYIKENNEIKVVNNLISIWEKGLELIPNSINSLLYNDSKLVNFGFYNEINKRYNNWDEYWENIEGFKIPNINKSLIDSKNIIKLFLKDFNTMPSLPIEMFGYLKGLKEKVNLISKLKNGKILIHGKSLSGKKTLINSILSTIKYKGYELIRKDKANKDENKLNELRLADKILKSFNKSALIIDNGENYYDLKENNNNIIHNESLQFWSVTDLSKMNEKLLKSFDLVIEIESPPLNERINLSRLFFKDERIAIRLAQVLKDPFEIIKVGKLCNLSQDYSWSNISLIIGSFQNIENKDSKIELNKLDNSEDIIPLVGNKELSELLNKLINFYNNPNKYLEIGAKQDNGILLIGPPGTGKTHFAKNLSKIVNIPMFSPETSILASNIENINKVFKELKRHAPCILFLDEIDTLISNPKDYGIVNLEKQKIVNAFLSNIDGIESNDGILIIGTTHRSNNFDPAAIRSGRLSKVIDLNLPDNESRKEIWKVHIKNKKIDTNIKLEELVKLSVGFSCADIMEASNKAAILSVEKNKDEIDISDFKIACDEVFWGHCNESMIINENQKKLTAYHEAGHALLAWKNGYNVERITIRPRKNMLGATHYKGEDGIFNMSMEDIKKSVQICLGGICAEKIIFGYYENGGVGDLKNANEIISHAIEEAGLGKEGSIYLGDKRLWSNEKRIRIENEEKEIINREFNETENYLKLNKKILIDLANYLLTEKEISGQDVLHLKEKLVNKKMSKNKIEQTNIMLHNQDK